MDLSPPALTRSPVSTPNTHCSQSPTLGYPSPDLAEPLYKIASLYEQSCAAVSSTMDPGHQLPPLDSMTSAEWSGPAVIQSSSGVPNVLSADYDPFAHYEPTMHAPYSHDLYSSHPVQAPVLSNTPPHLPSTSSHSPELSSRPAFSYHPSASPIPRVKMENAVDYASCAESSQYPSPRSTTDALSMESSSYGPGAVSPGYLSDVPSGSWPRSEYSPMDPDQYYAGGSNAGHALHPDRRQALRAVRPQRRQPRKLTTKEEANFQCEVKGCGKLFSRSYNYKAHLETHDEKREYPFPCTVGDCNKKFVRKTDLQRHNQSVHMKERNHKCDYCGRTFARKDTLRRHMEDGCSRRFDIGTLDFRGGEEYEAYPAPPRPLPSSSGHLAAPPAQLPPMTMPGGDGSHYLAPMPPWAKR
ncbi:hypothetical protein F4780DRAFT_760353 [Xylariomycetidae sp. FL0641]|nr:hypothetical protein F4780DRAFT_760353 [Xylariomycetidae sp. FL0641]